MVLMDHWYLCIYKCYWKIRLLVPVLLRRYMTSCPTTTAQKSVPIKFPSSEIFGRIHVHLDRQAPITSWSHHSPLDQPPSPFSHIVGSKVCAIVATTGSGHHSQATSKPFFFPFFTSKLFWAKLMGANASCNPGQKADSSSCNTVVLFSLPPLPFSYLTPSHWTSASERERERERARESFGGTWKIKLAQTMRRTTIGRAKHESVGGTNGRRWSKARTTTPASSTPPYSASRAAVTMKIAWRYVAFTLHGKCICYTCFIILWQKRRKIDHLISSLVSSYRI
jgi:hypothetical protein